MTPERWARVVEIYESAVTLEPRSRAAFVADASAGDETLRREVESLLAHDGTPVLIDRPVLEAAAVVLDPDAKLETNSRLGPYRIESLVGAGGMGQVYRATDTRLHRTVAVKVLSAAVAGDVEFRARFEREAHAIARLTHPHICTLYDVGQHDGIDYLVLEYLEGETLDARLERGALPFEHALRWAVEIADALSTAHRHGIIHRDLKPANIFLTPGSSGSAPPMAKLLDFGLAKRDSSLDVKAGSAVGPTAPMALTAHGTILGTFQYMAPEQIEGRDVDERTDIFAFGAVLYEMFTGVKVFEGSTKASIIAAILEREPPLISSTRPLTPPLLEHIVQTCLAKHPEDRWQTARDLLRELKRVRQEQPAPAVNSVREDSRRRSSSSAFVWAAVMLAVASALATWWATTWLTPPPPEWRTEFTTPTTDSPASIALSPDGLTIAFVADDQGQSRLWLRSFASDAARPVAGTEGARGPFWSPDGESVGFFAGEQLKVLDVAGRSIRMLASAPTGNGGAWNRDGVIVFAPTSSGALLHVPAGGGATVQVTRLGAGQRSHAFPKFLPDGHHFLYQVAGTADARGVYVGTLDGLEGKRLADTGAAAFDSRSGQLLFVRDGTLLAQHFDRRRLELTGVPLVVAEGVSGPGLTVSGNGVLAVRSRAHSVQYRYAWVDRSGAELEAVGGPSRSQTDWSLSPDERRLAFAEPVQDRDDSDVRVLDIARDRRLRLTDDPAVDGNPLWSPIDDRIVFTRCQADGNCALYLTSASGSGEKLLVTGSGGRLATDWSRDGRFLLFKQLLSIAPTGREPSRGRSTWGLWAMRMDGSGQPFAVVQNRFENRDGQFSPDGNWIAYHSNESGDYEIYVQPFPRSGKNGRIPVAPGTQARWRSDGMELFYVAPDGWLMAVPVQLDRTGRAMQIGTASRLFPTRLAGGVVAPINRQQYTPNRDGTRFLVHMVAEQPAAIPVRIIRDWRPRADQ